MPIRILMPALSPTMTEGNLAKWLKKEGDPVKSGDILAEIETDKATMEVEAIDEGTLGKIVVPEGTQGVKINAVIAVLLEEGEDKAALAGVASAMVAAPAPAGPTPAPVAAPAPSASALVARSAAAAPATAGAGDDRVFASPLARRMAEQAGVALGQLKGSGPHGRIIKADIEAALAGGRAQPASLPVAAPMPMPAAMAPAQPGAAYDDVLATNVRRIVAKRLQESKQLVPHFYLTIDCEIDRLLAVRQSLNERAAKIKLSLNDLVIRLTALALWKMPKVNVAWIDGVIRTYRAVDISVAVAIDDGLITPIIRNAERKNVFEIAEEMRDLAERARAKPMKLRPEEFQGGTFSISNLGMYGVKQFEAIINSPQACILAVGAGEQRAVVKDGALAVATVMSCTLSVDHRVVDGALGAEYLRVFKALIEDPPSVLL